MRMSVSLDERRTEIYRICQHQAYHVQVDHESDHGGRLQTDLPMHTTPLLQVDVNTANYHPRTSSSPLHPSSSYFW